MRTWAIINIISNIVENIIVWDGVSPWQSPEGTYMIECTDNEDAQIGGTYDPDTQTFIEAPEPEHTTTTAAPFPDPPASEPQTEPVVI